MSGNGLYTFADGSQWKGQWINGQQAQGFYVTGKQKHEENWIDGASIFPSKNRQSK